MNKLKFYLKQDKGESHVAFPENVMDDFAILNLKIVDYDKNASLKEKQRLINRAVYNQIDKDFRNNLRNVRKNETSMVNIDDVPEVLDTLPNSAGINNHIMDTEEVVINKVKEEYYKKEIRKILKKDTLYDVFMATTYSNYSVKEYADLMGVERSTMEHRQLKAMELLRENTDFIKLLKENNKNFTFD